ncbi:MAG: alpha/beta fold hydrolase [Alphaproteobacteria bacterium]|nr:alpha/beta fold hydrolase [Alphaproteobacteria bacterium]
MTDLNRFFPPDSWQEDYFTSTSGKQIRYGHAEPEGEKKGTVVITTGYADFIEAYHETMHEYLSRGYDVWVMDWAGHGGSTKKTDGAHVKGQTVEDHVEDLRKFRQEIVQPVKDKPVFLSTHSMGGQIALRYLSQHGGDFNFAILATPLVEARLKGPVQDLLRIVFASAVKQGMGEENIPDGRRSITRHLVAERSERNDKNPVRMGLHKAFMLLDDTLKAEDPTIGYVHSLLSSTERTGQEEFLKTIKTPILFGIGTEDDVIDNDSVRRAAKIIPHAKVTEVEGGIHALWLDRDAQRADWWKKIDAYIAAQATGSNPQPKPPQAKGP